MNEPRISVVVPVFNAAAHLRSLLASLLGQSEPALQIIAVDDGSTDGSLSILQEVAQKDRRLTVFSQANQGVSAARNHALRHVRGRWIAFADSDDWLHPRTLEIWREQAERAQLDLLIGNTFEFSGEPEAQRDPAALLRCQPWNEVMGGAEWIKRSVAACEWPHYAWLQFVSRDLLLRTRAQFVEGIVHEDILWTLQLALGAQRVGFCATPVYGYRVNPESLMRSPSAAAVHARAQSYLFVMQQLSASANHHRHDAGLRPALLRQVNREGGHFLGLMRRKVRDPALRRDLAREFFKRRLARAMFQGATNKHERWRALRCWLLMRAYVARGMGAEPGKAWMNSSHHRQ